MWQGELLTLTSWDADTLPELNNGLINHRAKFEQVSNSLVQSPQLHVCTSTLQSCKIRRSHVGASCLSGSCPDSTIGVLTCIEIPVFWEIWTPYQTQSWANFQLQLPDCSFAKICLAAYVETVPQTCLWSYFKTFYFTNAEKLFWSFISLCFWELNPKQTKFLGFLWSGIFQIANNVPSSLPVVTQQAGACLWNLHTCWTAIQSAVNRSGNVGVIQSGTSMLSQSHWHKHKTKTESDTKLSQPPAR